MSLGQVRMRPKANKPSITNASAMEGGLFGREPTTYGQIQPGGGGRGGGGGLDFLDRLEQAEGRDTDRLNSSRQRSRAATKQKSYGKRTQDGGFTDDGWAFGDDSMPQRATGSKNSMYQTSNGATNEHMKQVHEQAQQWSVAPSPTADKFLAGAFFESDIMGSAQGMPPNANGQPEFNQLPEMLRKLADSPSQSELSSYSTNACRFVTKAHLGARVYLRGGGGGGGL